MPSVRMSHPRSVVLPANSAIVSTFYNLPLAETQRIYKRSWVAVVLSAMGCVITMVWILLQVESCPVERSFDPPLLRRLGAAR